MKVRINKYLRNIGTNEQNYWVISEKPDGDLRYEEDEDGFVEAETWNLNATLAMINYSYLCYFREHCLHCYPANLTMEKWKEYLDKMILAFELILKDDDEDISFLNGDELKKHYEKKHKKIKFGLNLFVKYFNDLWW